MPRYDVYGFVSRRRRVWLVKECEVDAETDRSLTALAVSQEVSASIQNQAHPAFLFLCRRVLNRQEGGLGEVTRAGKPHLQSLRERLREVKANHEKDLAAGWGRGKVPEAFDREYRHAPLEWRCQWILPQEDRWRSTMTDE